jgi:lipopolysaccharide/colanic/teichoic acid biosynthesis glycosyltransferase
MRIDRRPAGPPTASGAIKSEHRQAAAQDGLDQLPQPIDALRGDMSLVGPRPHATAARAGDVPCVEAVDDDPLRHRLKPGIGGWAPINGWRGETERIEQLQGVQCDLYPLENWSLTLDLVILGRTAVTVLSRHNAV